MVAFKALPALGLLALLVASTTALSTQEIAGLQAMMASMPGLTSPFGIMHWSNSDIGNACNWRGITCKENSIVTLTVRDYMGGSLPDAIGGFVNMTSFSLLKSGCTGTIPRSINKWTKLHDFWIDTSEITGNLPDILSFPRLNSFYVQRCKINGQLPPEWAKHQSLVWLYLNGNEISGSIPESWNSWSKLVYLQLNENKLTGPVPSFIGSPNIYTVWLQKNMLSGTLPAQWGPVVGDLSLGNNQLVGTIPQWNLQTNTPYRIDLSNNQLVGTIPDIFGPSEYWRYIDLQNNRLTGTLPNSIGSMNQLRGLYVQGNMLTLCPAPNPFQLTTQFGDSYCDVSGQIGVNNCACASVYASQTCKVSAC